MTDKQMQEPVATMTVLHLKDRTEIGYGPYSAGYDLPTGEYKLYTTPPAQRQWVGLTDEDEIPWDGVDAKSFAHAIETKLRSKNGY